MLINSIIQNACAHKKASKTDNQDKILMGQFINKMHNVWKNNLRNNARAPENSNTQTTNRTTQSHFFVVFVCLQTLCKTYTKIDKKTIGN